MATHLARRLLNGCVVLSVSVSSCAGEFYSTDVMAEGTSGEQRTGQDEPLQRLDKEVVKEALAELLDDIPAFLALKAQPSQHTSDSTPPPAEGECRLLVRAYHSPLDCQRMIGAGWHEATPPPLISAASAHMRTG